MKDKKNNYIPKSSGDDVWMRSDMTAAAPHARAYEVHCKWGHPAERRFLPSLVEGIRQARHRDYANKVGEKIFGSIENAPGASPPTVHELHQTLEIDHTAGRCSAEDYGPRLVIEQSEARRCWL